MTRWAAVVAYLMALGTLGATAGGCGGGASKAECKKMIAHVVDVYVKEGGGDALSDEAKKDLAKNRKVVQDHVAKSQLDKCLNDLPQEQVQCTLKAKSLADIAKCEPE